MAGYDHYADRVWIKYVSYVEHGYSERNFPELCGKVYYSTKTGKFDGIDYDKSSSGGKRSIPDPELLRDRPDFVGLTPLEMVDVLNKEYEERVEKDEKIQGKVYGQLMGELRTGSPITIDQDGVDKYVIKAFLDADVGSVTHGDTRRAREKLLEYYYDLDLLDRPERGIVLASLLDDYKFPLLQSYKIANFKM